MFLDPDCTGGDVVGVIVRRATGVAYGSQCEGLMTADRYLEGYFVPISGLRFDPDAGRVDVATLRSVFHAGGRCLHASSAFDASECVDALRSAVAEIPFWWEDAEGESHRAQLALDEPRLAEAVEGWVPVLTPSGPGVLIWPNCD